MDHTFLRSAQPVLSPTHLIARSHQYLPEPLLLPGRKHEYARQIIVIPAHLLLAEEANDLPLPLRTNSTRLCIVAETGIRNLRCGIMCDEEVV
jgi:hypothetical protein